MIKLSFFFDKIIDFFAAISCFIIAFQAVSVSVEVVLRYFFGISFPWVLAVNEWGLVYLTFLGAAWLQREGGHIGDKSISKLFPNFISKPIALFGLLLSILSCLVMVVYGSMVTYEKYIGNSYDYFKLSYVPTFYIYLIIPIGALFWLIQIIREIVTGNEE